MEEDIWLGADVKIMDGCHVGKGVIIGAGSLVNKDIPDYKVVAGSPARILKSRAKSPGDSGGNRDRDRIDT